MIFNPQTLIDDGILITNGMGKVAQVGYDCTVSAISRVEGFLRAGQINKDSSTIPPYIDIEPISAITDKIKYWELQAGFYSLTFDQGCNLPSGVTAYFQHRSSLLRSGAQITSGIYDPGFQVKNMGALMICNLPIVIEKGARLAQFIAVDSQPSPLYNGQFQGSKDKK